MGNACNLTSEQSHKNYRALGIYAKNTYPRITKQYTGQYAQYFSTKQTAIKYEAIFNLQPNSKFLDDKFPLQNSARLSELIEYQKQKTMVYNSKTETNMTIFFQKCNIFCKLEVQFTYLTSIFYMFCKNKYFLDHLFETRITNIIGFYLLNLYTFGDKTDVIIDDKFPVKKHKLQYCTLSNYQQIWPLLIQKAWCKQVGGFQLTKGLSPQDAFEEITGIPAYSYNIQDQVLQQLFQSFQKYFQKGYWIVLTAKQNLKDIQSRQVFYVQNAQKQQLSIRSSYYPKEFNQLSLQDANLLKINIKQLKEHFQFITMGFFRPYFQTVSFRSKSDCFQQKIFEIHIQRQDEVSIRIIQFYEAYLPADLRKKYEYSPMIVQLYNEQFQLVQFCQGCPRTQTGARSSHFSPNILQVLKKGKYYIKIEIGWINDKQFNEFVICVYTSRQNATIKPMPTNYSITKFIKQFHNKLLLRSTSTQVIKQITLKKVEKQNGMIISLQNNSNETQKLKLNFQNCTNIRYKYCHCQNSNVIIDMIPKQIRNIEIVVLDSRLSMMVDSFHVEKI